MQVHLEVKGKEAKVKEEVGENVREEVGKDKARKVKLQERAIVEGAVKVELKEVKEGETWKEKVGYSCVVYSYCDT